MTLSQLEGQVQRLCRVAFLPGVSAAHEVEPLVRVAGRQRDGRVEKEVLGGKEERNGEGEEPQKQIPKGVDRCSEESRVT